MKYWETITNKIINAGFSVGLVSAINDDRRTVWIVDADRDKKRFIARADEKLSAFLQLESAIRVAANWLDELAIFFQTRRR